MAQPRINRSERAYRYLTEGVQRGRWAPGDTLSTYALAEELGISRTPVLEALKRLEADGLVEIVPQVGCRIVEPSTGAVEELLSVRGAIDGLAAEAAARRIDARALAQLDATLGELEDAARRGDRAAFEDLSQRFHLAVAEASGMPRLAAQAASLWSQLRHQLARVPVGENQLRESVPDHREIYEALRRRAPRRARLAAERDVRGAAARFARAAGNDDARGLLHSALIYDAEEAFVAGTVPFVRDGLRDGERVLAVTTARNRDALAAALGPQADEVEFRDSAEWYTLPSHTMLSYERYIAYADSPRVRVIGEVAWGGDSRAAMSEWIRYEAAINVAFAPSPVTIMCPYDDRRLPEPIVAGARRTHPAICTGADCERTSDYTDLAAVTRELDHEGLPAPEGTTSECPLTHDLRDVRGFILEQGHRAGVRGKALQDAFLAAQEVAANVIVHGAGHGTMRAWVQDGELIYEVADAGRGIGDPRAGYLEPTEALIGASGGLWLARLLCDLVQVRTHDDGLVVRLHVALD